MTPTHIRLNFLAVTPRRFTVSCWRQRVSPEEKKPDERFIWRYDLPERPDDALSPKHTYLVRFAAAEGFEEFAIGSNVHRDLSNAALFHALQNQVAMILPAEKYYISRTAFRPRRLSVTMNSTKVGKQTVWLEPYYLDASQEFGFLIDFKFVLDRNVPFNNREAQRLSLSLDRNFRSNKDCYIDRFEFVDRFLREISPQLFPLTMASGSQVGLDLSLVELPIERLNEKVFVFGGDNKAPSQWNGLNKFGPFAQAPKPIRFVYVYRKHQRTLAEDLYKGIDGKIPDFSFPGIQKLTSIRVTGYDKIEMIDLSNTEIDNVIGQIVELSSRNKFDEMVLPIFISDKENTDAYYRLKLGLLQKDIPVQVVTAKLIGNRSSLKWSVANIALQIFSKAGGTAWHVQPCTKDCLIFGIGQAHKKEGRSIRRYFAYSVCTDSSGAYKRLSILGDGTDRRDYLGQLRQRIVAEVQDMSGQYKHCAIHIPFSIRRDESMAINDALRTAVEERKLPPIHLSIIKVNMDNKFFGYANTNSLIPYAGSVMALDDHGGYLAWFDGLQRDREVIQRRVGGPVHVQWLWSSENNQTREDQRRMLQDLLNLSGANWRGFNAKSEPISVYYCELIARFSKHFGEVLGHVAGQDSPWFL